MSFLRSALERRDYPLDGDHVSSVSAQFPMTAPDVAGSTGWQAGMVWRGSGPGSIGNEQAMRLSAVFACLRLLSENVATLPLDTFFRQGGVRKPYRPRPAYLSFDPPQQSRIDYLSQVMLSLLTDGNAYVLTLRDDLGDVLDLIVLDPTLVHVTRVKGRVKYECQGIPLDPFLDIMHIKAMCLPGAVTGLSPLGYAMEAARLGLVAQEYGVGFLDNSAVPAVALQAPSKFGDEAQKRFLAGWDRRHRGPNNAGKVAVLTEGATLNRVSISPEEAQFLQTRAFQIPDIARFFGVPPHLIADASNSTSWGSGLAEQNQSFAQLSLRPWTERIEDGHSRLLSTHGLPTVFVKLNMDAVLRASKKERYEANAIMADHEALTVNEWRADDDMAPVPWGDVPFVPSKITETGVAPADAPGLTGPRDAPAAGGKP